jgi:hypothetical protein
MRLSLYACDQESRIEKPRTEVYVPEFFWMFMFDVGTRANVRWIHVVFDEKI